MSTDIVTPVMQHALDVGRLYLQNATLKQGVPERPGRLYVGPAPAPANSGGAPAAVEGASPVPDLAAGLWRRAMLATAAAGLLGGAGLGAVALHVLGQRSPPPPVVQPGAATPATQHGSLLQYLEDGGFHLPPQRHE